MAFFGPLKLSEAQSSQPDYINQIGSALAARFPGASGFTAYPGAGGKGTGALGFTYNTPPNSGVLEGVKATTPESLTALLGGVGAPASVEELISRVPAVNLPPIETDILSGIAGQGAQSPFAQQQSANAATNQRIAGLEGDLAAARAMPVDPYQRSLQLAGVAPANQLTPSQPDTSGGGSGGDSVICTHLHARGYMSDEMYAADERFGKTLDHATYRGYRTWADSVVRLMEKYPSLTPIVASIAQPWTVHMAYRQGVGDRDSWIGKTMMVVGSTV
jgi:hypothetical protein